MKNMDMARILKEGDLTAIKLHFGERGNDGYPYLIPSIISMIFLSFYTTIDGFFISKYVDSNGLAAINIVIPLTCIFFGISIMLATGGGALIGIRQGQGRMEQRDRKSVCRERV